MLAIAIDRYRAVLHPIDYFKNHQKTQPRGDTCFSLGPLILFIDTFSEHFYLLDVFNNFWIYNIFLE